jgi:hypothetical protein
MNKLSPRLSAVLWWLAPLAALAAMIGWETEWSGAIAKAPPPEAAIESKPIVASVLPEFEIPGGVDARSESVSRTLFNPTRRPAPSAAQEGGAQRLKSGQFALTGTMLVDGKNIALLREISVNKPRRVKAGETINGMKVAEVKADRVKFTLGEESEELVLKVATNPRPTPQPAVAAAAPAAPAAAPAAAAPVVTAGAPPGAAAQVNAAQTLAERRRAARAAAAGGANGDAPAANQPGSEAWDAAQQRLRDRAAARQQTTK